MSSKQYVWMPVCERSLIPGVVAHVKRNKKSKKFELSILHPYSHKSLDKVVEFSTLEKALAFGAKRRLYYKYRLNIAYKPQAILQSAPKRGKITTSN